MYRIEVASDFQSLINLKEQWGYLFQKTNCDNPYLSWEWCVTWWKHFGRGKKLFIITVERDSECLGIAPLMIYRSDWTAFFQPVVRFLGDSDLKSDIKPDYMDFLAKEEEVAQIISLIFNHLLKYNNFKKIELRRFHPDSLSLPVIKDHLHRKSSNKGIVDFYVSTYSPYIKIDSLWEEYYKGKVSKSLRQNIRTSYNRLEKDGLEIKIESYDLLDKNDKVFLEIKEVHQKRQETRAGSGMFRKSWEPFMRDVCEILSRAGMLNLIVARINNILAAYSINLTSENVFYYWGVAFNPYFYRYSPGHLLLEQILQKSFKENYEKFDFMVGTEDYKFGWTKDSDSVYSLTFYRNYEVYYLKKLREQIVSNFHNIVDNSKTLRKIWIKLSKLVR